ncbi:SpoIIE family protein phosphatase [Isoptericola sp. b441]|uniref:SpoIIE family protein phosphatase n=1 Tax=Actinotalea lenta TaxID=3064654 RepID=A0ABT9D574_9CELL|nr:MULTISPECIES: SpoIIE family protein phosphatase [unclassified Isoptericola]MDO8105915.1 SpoIIE family protein phosphatase [Isoptericola sp. b441]MDO8122630.1 SpoIIE family protein phosphatase [Isoptericola sp. b490]
MAKNRGEDLDLAAVRDRAIRATTVSVVITGPRDAGTPIIWANDAYTRVTGWRLEEVQGRNPSLLHGPGTDHSVARRLAEAVAAGEPATATVLNYRKDGTEFWNQVSISPVLDEDGRIGHWVGIQVDVTDQVERADAQAASIREERRARAGLAMVSRVSDLLADLDDPYVLREIAALLELEVVGWAGFFVDDGDLRATSGIDAGPRFEGAARRRRRAGGAPDPVQDLLDGVRHDPVEVRLDARGLGPTTQHLVDDLLEPVRSGRTQADAVVVHPVTGRRLVQGVLVTAPRHGSGLAGYSPHDLTVLYLVVRRVGMAADNVRLYAREHRLAETLQRAMLPEQAEIRGLDVWTYYAPSSGHAQVGGDWYDVLEVSPDHVVLVIGDVVGHDVEAAAVMGQLRSVVRAYAHDDAAPGAVLDRVDQHVGGVRLARPASLVLVSMTREADGWRLQWARGGHLPAVLVREGRAEPLAEASGPMIGFGVGGRGSGERVVGPGDLLVLFTDGLIERRERTLREGLGALLDVVAPLGGLDAAGVGEALLASFADAPEDDVAVVVVRVPDPGSAPAAEDERGRRRRWSLPSEPGSIARSRHAVLRACEAWGIPGRQSAELVVSELVANAVLHGWGHLVLRLFDVGGALRIEVEDANPAPPVSVDGHTGRVGGYGMRIVERLARWGWEPTAHGKLVWAEVDPAVGAPGPG